MVVAVEQEDTAETEQMAEREETVQPAHVTAAQAVMAVKEERLVTASPGVAVAQAETAEGEETVPQLQFGTLQAMTLATFRLMLMVEVEEAAEPAALAAKGAPLANQALVAGAQVDLAVQVMAMTVRPVVLQVQGVAATLVIPEIRV